MPNGRTTTLLLILSLRLTLGTILAGNIGLGFAQAVDQEYTKAEYRIPMRDGVRLFTAVYSPTKSEARLPILMLRTPYGIHPYGEDKFPTQLGPSRHFLSEGFIFVYQDVRGRYMSEGQFVNMTPHNPNKRDDKDVDESSDTFDTIEWLLENVDNHNGRVGMWGISYPGFYAAVGMIDAHPALKAVSPQAPIADWFFDDFHHHGAFFLPHAFDFLAIFGRPRTGPTTEKNPRFQYPASDGYQFYMEMSPLNTVNQRYLKGEVAFWDDLVTHPNYDNFWKIRNILPHLKDVAPAVMTVGGWFDAEDLYGPLQTYRSVEEKNPGIFNILVMGPWSHGGWSQGDGNRLGEIDFGSDTADFYREGIELPFFLFFLKDREGLELPEAYLFGTGENKWRSFSAWPPPDRVGRTLYFREEGGLSPEEPLSIAQLWDEYVSDPRKPVPFSEELTNRMTRKYMIDDQRFAARRPDVLVYQTDVLEKDLSLAGPLQANLWVSTSGTDSDFVVKLIDVLPATSVEPGRTELGGYQMMVRSEVMRGRFRNSYEKPEPFVPNQPTQVILELQDVLHTFKEGHRLMIQIQSTWFPLIDRNPQRYLENMFNAKGDDYTPAIQRLYRSEAYPSRIQFGVLE